MEEEDEKREEVREMEVDIRVGCIYGGSRARGVYISWDDGVLHVFSGDAES